MAPCTVCPPAVFYLWELALFVDEGDDVHGLGGDHVKGVLVVSELDVLPVDVLQVVLLLLQLKDVTHKELLQILVGKVDAELLKTKKIWRGKNTRETHFLHCKNTVMLVYDLPVDNKIFKTEDVQ